MCEEECQALKEDFPTRKEVFGLRSYPEVFFWTCDVFLIQVVGVQKFKKLSTKVCISQQISRSDEAFMLLILDNNWARWTDMARNGCGDSNVPTKYTHRGKEARKYGGWTNEGLKKYNLLMKHVSANRDKEDAQEVENKYVRHRLRLSKQPVGPEDDELDGTTGEGEGRIQVLTDLFGQRTDVRDDEGDEMREWLEELQEEEDEEDEEADKEEGVTDGNDSKGGEVGDDGGDGADDELVDEGLEVSKQSANNAVNTPEKLKAAEGTESEDEEQKNHSLFDDKITVRRTRRCSPRRCSPRRSSRVNKDGNGG